MISVKPKRAKISKDCQKASKDRVKVLRAYVAAPVLSNTGKKKTAKKNKILSNRIKKETIASNNITKRIVLNNIKKKIVSNNIKKKIVSNNIKKELVSNTIEQNLVSCSKKQTVSNTIRNNIDSKNEYKMAGDDKESQNAKVNNCLKDKERCEVNKNDNDFKNILDTTESKDVKNMKGTNDSKDIEHGKDSKDSTNIKKLSISKPFKNLKVQTTLLPTSGKNLPTSKPFKNIKVQTTVSPTSSKKLPSPKPLFRPNEVDSVVIGKEHVCTTCGKVCKDFIEFEVHNKRHKSRMKIEPEELEKFDAYVKEKGVKFCPICGTACQTYGKWVRHMVIHSKALNYSCSICKKKFLRIDHVKNHEKRHELLYDLKAEADEPETGNVKGGDK